MKLLQIDDYFINLYTDLLKTHDVIITCRNEKELVSAYKYLILLENKYKRYIVNFKRSERKIANRFLEVSIKLLIYEHYEKYKFYLQEK